MSCLVKTRQIINVNDLIADRANIRTVSFKLQFLWVGIYSIYRASRSCSTHDHMGMGWEQI